MTTDVGELQQDANSMSDELSSQDRSEYRRLCKVIDEKLSGFVEVANALKKIKDAKLYKSEFDSFEEFCQTKYKFGINYANKLISAAKVKENVESKSGTRVPKEDSAIEVQTEAQARALSAAPEEKQAEAWEAAVEKAGGEQPTAKQVKEAVAEIVAEEKPEAPTDKTGVEVCGALVVTFQNLDKFKEFDSAVDRCMRLAGEIAELAGGEYVKPHLQRIQSDLRKARVAVKESRPHAQCMKCKGKGCDHCNKFGYLLKSQFELKTKAAS